MTVPRAVDRTEPLTIETALAQAHDAALRDSTVGPVGLELETHLVDLSAPGEAVAWDRIAAALPALRAAAGRTPVTLEPGGQVELSGLPAPDIAAAVGELRRDAQRVRLALADVGLGVAHVGADPLRPSRRINPRARYAGLLAHYAATGQTAPGTVMMDSTASLQLNLEAGPAGGWADRVSRAYRLGPTLIAATACSPWLSGSDTGWKSARQRAWYQFDARTCGVVPGCDTDPAAAWARFALRAPVAFVRTETAEAAPVSSSVPFEAWLSGAVPLARRAPTADDLATHLTTLFPPVRLRGYLEVRYLDTSPPRWWPAAAGALATLLDDPVAADLADEATEQAAHRWTEAARDGLADPILAASARRCLRIAADRVAPPLAAAVADLAELVDTGRCPGDLLAERIAETGVHAAFEELAHA